MKKNFFYVDLIKVTAICLVVFLHTAGVHLGSWNKVPFNVWMIENTYDAFTRMSVPLFVMVSGAMMLQKEEPYKDFFRKKFIKIAIPAVVWVSIYMVWRAFMTGEHLRIREMIKMILSGTVYYHLWYLYMIVGLYLVTPALRKLTKNSTKKELIYFTSLWLIFVSILPTLLNIIKIKYNIELMIGITLPVFTGHVGYYILGYQLNQYEPKKVHICVSWVGMFISFILTTFGTLYCTSILGVFNDTFYSYFSPTVVVEAVCCFNLLCYYGKLIEKNLSEKTKSVFSQLALASFGVYLFHPIIRDILLKKKLYFCVDTLEINPIISNPLAAIEVLVISYIIILIILRIPIINLGVGGGKAKKKQTV